MEFFNLRNETTDVFPLEIAENLLNKFTLNHIPSRTNIEIRLLSDVTHELALHNTHSKLISRIFNEKESARAFRCFFRPRIICAHNSHIHTNNARLRETFAAIYMVHLLVRQRYLGEEKRRWRCEGHT